MAEEKKNESTMGSFPIRPDGEMAVAEREPLEMISVSDNLDALDRAVQTTAKMVETYKAIRGICLRLTNESDWSYQGDGLYLAETGAQKLGIAWGVDMTPEKIEREDFDDASGRYYVYTVFGTAFSRRLGRLVREIGTCSSRDDFFGKVTLRAEDGTYSKEWKALDKVDVTDVKKKAMTNFMGRSIKRLLGLGNVTEEELVMAKLDPKKIEKVDYKKGRKTDEANASPELKKVRGEIDSIATFLSAGDAEAKAGYIRSASYFKSGEKEMFQTEAAAFTSERWAATTLGRIRGVLKEQYPDEYQRRYPNNGHSESAKPAAATLGRIRGVLKEQYPDEYQRRYPNNGHSESAKPAAAGPKAGTGKEADRGGR